MDGGSTNVLHWGRAMAQGATFRRITPGGTMSNEREKQGRWGRLTGGSRGAAGGDRSWRRTAQESARLYYRMDQDEAARNRRRGVVTLALEFRIPNFAGDEANERRRTHLDLAGLSDADLEAEGHRAR